MDCVVNKHEIACGDLSVIKVSCPFSFCNCLLSSRFMAAVHCLADTFTRSEKFLLGVLKKVLYCSSNIVILRLSV